MVLSHIAFPLYLTVTIATIVAIIIISFVVVVITNVVRLESCRR